MKRGIIKVLVSVMLVLALTAALASCDVINGLLGETPDASVDLSGITLADKTFTYDGEEHSLEIDGTLPEGVTVKYENNDQTNTGKYTVVAKFYNNGEYIEGADLSAILRINKGSYTKAMEGVSFPGATFTYDGTAKSIAIKGTLPEGVTVEYVGNGVSAVGKHTVTAKFTVDTDNYYPIDDMIAVINIVEAPVEDTLPDLSGITFAGATYTYDGTAKSLAIEGTLPEGVTVQYENNGKTDAGSYVVAAKFYQDGVLLETISMRATLKIEKAATDLSGITFAGATHLYDGTAKSLAISGILPDHVTVSYIGNGQIAPGSYKVVATFNTGKNYESVPDMEATLTILGSGAGLSDVNLFGKTVTYTGEAQSLAITGTLPEGVTVEYIGNGMVNAGTYTVTAKFYQNGVYIEGGDLGATLVIAKADVDMSGVSFADASFVSDGTAKSVYITGTLPEGVTVEYVGNGVSAPGSYTVTAKFTVADTANYNAPADMTAELVISFNAASLSGITFTGATFTYDGIVHRIEIAGALPEGVTVRYDDNAAKDAGSYSATAKFYYNGEYIEGADLGATLVIAKADIDMSGVILEDAIFIYNGETQSLAITGTLPEGVSVEYIGNSQIAIGTYTVIARFTVADAANYNTPADMTAELTIEPDPKDVSEITFTGITVTYDGNEYSIFVEGTLNAGITVEYVGNGVKAIGSHTVTAKFYYNGEYIEGADKTAVIVIEHSNAALGELVFESASFKADGAPKSIFITGTLPEGYTVEYVGNGESAPGTYTVTAKFYYDGTYQEGSDMVATYTITSASLPVIEVSDLTVDFDGKSHEIIYTPAEPLPAGVSVIRIGEAQYKPGTYTFVFRYSLAAEVAGQYEIGEDVVVTLTINEFDGDYSTEGLVYKAVTGGYAVVGYEGDSAVVIIPATYNNKAVIAISANAFRNNPYIKSVTVPDSVTAIGQGAFYGTLVEEITLPFIGGSKTSSNRFLGYIFGASAYAANEVYVPVTLEKVILSDACTYIPARAFYGCVSLKDVVIGAGVTEIAISAFEKCSSLESIYIPVTVTSIPAAANYYNSPFFDCAEGLTVYLGAAAVPSVGYGTYWNAIGNGVNANVVTGVTYNQYLAATGK